MIVHKYVSEYIELYETGTVLLNKERIMLIHYLKQDILTRNDLHFDMDLIHKCVTFIEKWHFKLNSFQKFLIAFVFLFDEYEDVYFDQHFWMMARGLVKWID